jgi:ATP-dependent Clp protease adaptor protein ClpS
MTAKHPHARKPPPPVRDDPGTPRGPGAPAGPERDVELVVRERPKTALPRRWRVLLHNDDYTTMEFVISMLVRHFEKTESEAAHIMLQVHHLGVGVAGSYTRDEAETRVEAVTREARTEGFPLLLTTEPE